MICTMSLTTEAPLFCWESMLGIRCMSELGILWIQVLLEMKISCSPISLGFLFLCEAVVKLRIDFDLIKASLMPILNYFLTD